jgi:hypothetical protein
MKTVLPIKISTVDEAKELLTNLYNNDETFHPEDDATTVGNTLNGDWKPLFTKEEGEHLNELMGQIYLLDGNNGNHATPLFDPCEFLLELDGHVIEME